MERLEELQQALRRFATDRDWEQYHSPKNLAMALAGEVGELLEIFQWLTAEESANLNPDQQAALEQELADILIYLARLADVAGVDLLAAASEKLAANEGRYPVERSRGSAAKYTDLGGQ